MCGIAAIFSYSDSASPVDSDELLRIRDSMTARGPDGAGLWISRQSRIGMAHRRLSIIDLSETGSQPMSARGGRLQIVFNGEIYNYRALRQDLEKKGYHFISSSDTEVLLHLYTEKGPEMVNALRGMYAFALWDDDRQGLFLARDPFGIKPIYFHDDGHTFRCASQVKALLAGKGFLMQSEPAGHVGFFLWGNVPEPFTLYKNLFALPAGHTLWVDHSGMHAPKKYFDIAEELATASVKPIQNWSMRDVLRPTLQDSIQHHLIADVPVGVFLSSGIDSSVITALSSEISPFIKAVTLGFNEYEHSEQDEVPLSCKVADHYGCEHFVHRIVRNDFEQERGHILAAMDQPSIDGVNSYFVAQAAAQAGLKVVLSGLGGDELMGSYPSFHDVPEIVSFARLPAKLPGFGKAFRWLSASMIKRFTSPKFASLFEFGGTYGGAYLLRRGLFMPWELPEILDGDLIREGWEILQPILHLDDYVSVLPTQHARVSALELSNYMRNSLLRDSDWAGMAHSLEIRVPLVDIDVFRALAPYITKPDIKLSKQDMIKVPAKPLPDEIINHPKTGFSIPVQEWLGTNGPAQHSRGLRGWALNVYNSFDPFITHQSVHPKRILSLVSDAFGNSGGIAKYNRDLLTTASVSINISNVVALPRSFGQIKGLESFPLKLYYDINGIGGKWQYAREVIRILQYYHHFDLVLCGHINLLPLAFLAAQLKQAPLWCVIHGVDAWQPSKSRMVNWVVKRLDGFISVSEVTKERFVAWSGIADNLGFILPNCYDPTVYFPGPKQQYLLDRYDLKGKIVVMTVGRLADGERNKGFDEILENLPALVEKIPDLVYLVVGDGDDKGRLQEKATALGIKQRVVFTGFISEEEKPDIYRLADVYAMPSRGEGFGIVYLEAMACGIPTVGSKLDGGREALRNGQLGIIVDPQKPQEIQAGILQALAQEKGQIPAGLEFFSLSSFRQRVSQLLEHIFVEKG